ncbi:MAG: hypothetical protein QW409_01885 [Candidatus Aenigmatarchaeota archaeon]
MVRKWKKVDNKCIVCNREVAKVKLKDGKVEIIEDIAFGSFVKVKGKAELKMICRNCQKALDKEGKRYYEFIKN